MVIMNLILRCVKSLSFKFQSFSLSGSCDGDLTKKSNLNIFNKKQNLVFHSEAATLPRTKNSTNLNVHYARKISVDLSFSGLTVLEIILNTPPYVFPF
jgi:hypothetical protein